MSLKTQILISGMLAAALAGGAQAAAPVVSSADGATPLGGQGTGVVTLSFSGAYSLDFGGFDLAWNPAALELVPASSSVGGLSFAGLSEWLTNVGAVTIPNYRPEEGSMALSALGIDPPADLGNHTVEIVLAFKGLAVGSQPVTYHIDVHDFSDGGFGDSFDGTLHISVTAVPEPTTWALWLAGGAMVGSLARRRGKLS